MLFLKRLFRFSLPVLILAVGLVLYSFLTTNKPPAQRRAAPVPLIEVQVKRMQAEDYRVRLHTQGTVRARTTSTLIPEVSGRVMRVAPNFREGGFFSEGDVLLEIDDVDYRTAVTISRANLADARVRLAEEEARALQAEIDWQRLGRSDTPSELVLRGPQLALAQANVAAAEARLDEALRNLERTRITAPYEGRVLRKFADVGQVVGPGAVLAELFAVDYAEIRLPLNARQYSFLDIPADLRGADLERYPIPVSLTAAFGSELRQWSARIVRIEGAVDTTSRQIFVVAQVDEPYGPEHQEPLKVGLFVEAEIQGKLLESVYTLPRTSLREGRFAVMVHEESHTISRVALDPIWTNAQEVVFRHPDLPQGSMVSLTPLAIAVDGMTVRPVADPLPAVESTL